MIGTNDDPIQIDKYRFVDKRKYNWGRMLQGDAAALSEDSEADVSDQRNHGRRIDRPWVFGLRKGNDWKYFWVVRRDETNPRTNNSTQMRSRVRHSLQWVGCIQVPKLPWFSALLLITKKTL
jgi:hypothetical protein